MPRSKSLAPDSPGIYLLLSKLLFERTILTYIIDVPSSGQEIL